MRTGEQYLKSVAGPRGVYLEGGLVEDVATHPAFSGPTRTISRLFDLAADPSNAMAYIAPETGRKANRVFMIPRSRDDLVARRAAINVWADASLGFIGRGPDHVAGFFAGFSGGSDIFGCDSDHDFAANVREFHRRMLDQSLFVAYTILPPQFDRNTSAGGWDDEFIQAGVVDATREGIVIRGSMALGTAAPLADYLFVSCIKPLGAGDEPYANSFVVPVGAPGLRLICRKPYGRIDTSDYDYPLSTRFDESDCVAVFDDLVVPWQNVFIVGDPVRLRDQFFRTPAHVLGNSQAQIRFATKLKFILGIARKITMTNGIDGLPPVQDKLGELASLASLVEGMTIAAEASSTVDEFGVARPNHRFLYGIMAQQAELYPRVIHLLRDLSGVGVLQVPASSADFDCAAIGNDIRRYIRSPGVDAEERVKLFKLAWEVVGSEFAGRHQQYEMFYAGAPFITRGYAYRNYHYDEAVGCVEKFLASYSRPRTSPIAAAAEGATVGQ